MSTYLLTWNPAEWHWKNLSHAIRQVRRTGFCFEPWTCRSVSISPDDRVFLLRQGREPRGIVASGHALSERRWGRHHSVSGKKSPYVEVRWDALFREPILPRPRLSQPDLARMHWNTQSSGISIPPRIAARLETL